MPDAFKIWLICSEVNYFTSNWFSTGIEWRIPEKTATVWSVSKDFRLARSIGWIVWTLGDDRFAFEWFRDAVHVFGSHSEHIFLALRESFGSVTGSWTVSRCLPPVIGPVVGHLDDVVGDIGSTVVQGLVPGQRHGVLRRASVLKGTLGWSRSVDYDHLDIGRISTVLVRRCNRVETAVFPNRFLDQQVRTVGLCLGLRNDRTLIMIEHTLEQCRLQRNRTLTDIRRVSSSGLASLVHSMVGVGAPDIGIFTLIGSPARTLILRPISASRFNFGFSFIGLAINTDDVSLGLPAPAAFTAATRYSYWWPSVT